MSGYTELRDLGVHFRPWEGPMPPASQEWPRFKAPWPSTCILLARELRMLDAQGISLELDISEEDLRLDGIPRANAVMLNPAARISFTSRWGPLRYETAEFRHWRHNVRAIALSMEALRAVDRYGVSKRGEQYRGWRQLGTGSNPADTIVTREQAREYLSQWPTVKDALRATHPDTSDGDQDAFLKVQKSRELLGV